MRGRVKFFRHLALARREATRVTGVTRGVEVCRTSGNDWRGLQRSLDTAGIVLPLPRTRLVLRALFVDFVMEGRALVEDDGRLNQSAPYILKTAF